ncbi:Mor transcription activator family protein [Moraxella canis]|uniref:Mor transcription activator family protein n=1 Tax=Moraxella canis TaxID=90239 RepID=UPI0009933FEC
MVISEFKRTCGGLLWYIPKTDQSAITKQSKQIRECYTDGNIHQLSQEYNLSCQAIYQIIKQGK